jgi:hypothetical protein
MFKGAAVVALRLRLLFDLLLPAFLKAAFCSISIYFHRRAVRRYFTFNNRQEIAD